MEAIMCLNVSYSISLHSNVIAKSHWKVLGELLYHHEYWIPSGTPSCFPVVALCYGDLVALAQQDWPFCVLQVM